MNVITMRLLYWAPRVICILFAVFLSMFSLDVFGHNYGFWGVTTALLMHLLTTTGVVLVVLALAWRWEWIGAVVFTALGILYLVFAWGRFHWSAYVAISGPLFLVGILFLLSWFYRKEIRAGS
jgi:hypothetical protein